jgi:hypothetical protein
MGMRYEERRRAKTDSSKDCLEQAPEVNRGRLADTIPLPAGHAAPAPSSGCAGPLWFGSDGQASDEIGRSKRIGISRAGDTSSDSALAAIDSSAVGERSTDERRPLRVCGLSSRIRTG